MALALFLAAAVQQSVPLSPAAQWEVDYAEASCTLSRTFGAGDDRVTLAVMATPGRSFVDIGIISPAAASQPTRTKLTISPNGTDTINLVDGTGEPVRDGRRIARNIVSRQQAEALRDVETARLVSKSGAYDMKLSGTAAAFKALSACEDDLLKQWGYDPLEIASIATPLAPQGNPSSWVTDDDYPSGALRRNEQGRVMFRLDVDNTGKTTHCAVLRSSGFKELDDTVCVNMLARTRFKPARDAQGRAVRSLFVNYFTWRNPR